MGKWLIVGQGPSQSAVGLPAFTGKKENKGSSTSRLCGLMGISLQEFMEQTSCINVNDNWSGKNKKGDVFKPKTGEAADRVFEASEDQQKILICGKATARACGFHKHAILEWFAWRGRVVAIVPHPSGVNLWYNTKTNVRAAEDFLRSSWKAQ